MLKRVERGWGTQGMVDEKSSVDLMILPASLILRRLCASLRPYGFAMLHAPPLLLSEH